jgi:non-ribosomal peptide synthetase component E (peptide arylation enzyme)
MLVYGHIILGIHVCIIEPIRIVVTGRIKHFISAFGEHVIGEEVEKLY